ncbi:MAG TPA: response regulator [Candidatus Wunengus sp. YC60]|uniref:response regulator n=1 Tax=Candidatus Wunengus sp. YC60 TaxID=3367697 RepID=UPI0040282675
MKFLILDDDLDFRNLTIHELRKSFPDDSFVEITNQMEFNEALKRWDFDVVITDMDNPGLVGFMVCEQIRERDPYLPVIMLTASGNEELAVEGMKLGLSDYVTKKHLLRLPVAIKESIEKARIRRELDKTARLLKDSEERFRAFMDNSPTLHFIEDEDGHVVFANKAFSRIFKKSLNDVRGKAIWGLVSPEIAKSLREHNRDVLAEDKVIKLCETVPTPSGIPHYWLVVRFPIKDAVGKRYVGSVALDITELKLNEARQAAQFKLTQIFIESDTLSEAAPKLLQAICEGFGWELGELWRVDTDAKRLRLKDMWYTPSLGASEFEKISRTLDFTMGIGMPGRVWASGKPVWITDVVADSNFPRAATAEKLGVHGAMTFPITQGKEIIGVMGFLPKIFAHPMIIYSKL